LLQGGQTVTGLSLSSHAVRRANQRSVSRRTIDALVAHGDVECPVGSGCTVIRFSRDRLKDASLRGTLGGSIDQLKSLAVILSEDGEVVTVLHDRGGTAGRRYRGRH
jgi:hypothetical protein